MSGMVSGGWDFVWGAYLVSALLIGGYVVRTIAMLLGVEASLRHKPR